MGKLILRASLAILILLHGISKLLHGVDPVLGLLARAGMPAGLAYLVYVGEILAPLCLLVGIWTRLAAAIIGVNMLTAIWLAHAGQLFSLGKTGGWALELQGFYLFTALALVFLGAGRYSLGGAGGRLN
jgi:putative oxidoreductase